MILQRVKRRALCVAWRAGLGLPWRFREFFSRDRCYVGNMQTQRMTFDRPVRLLRRLRRAFPKAGTACLSALMVPYLCGLCFHDHQATQSSQEQSGLCIPLPRPANPDEACHGEEGHSDHCGCGHCHDHVHLHEVRAMQPLGQESLLFSLSGQGLRQCVVAIQSEHRGMDEQPHLLPKRYKTLALFSGPPPEEHTPLLI